MNQILETNDFYIFTKKTHISKNKDKKIYLFILIISVIIGLIILCYLFFSSLSRLNESISTSNIKEKYNIVSLYSNWNTYNAIQLSNNISIIGLIEIPSIQISYPILANSNEQLLKISVCRFSGPLPNRIGNMCIAGHNYRSNMMFSNLDKLKINDSIYITDLNNVRLEYIIYDIFKVKENNLDCIKNTSDIQVTLITCNENNNKERIVIKAKVKE